MAAITKFEDIQAWQQARILVHDIYKVCAEGRLSKDFGFRDQLCRAAVSSVMWLKDSRKRAIATLLTFSILQMVRSLRCSLCFMSL